MRKAAGVLIASLLLASAGCGDGGEAERARGEAESRPYAFPEAPDVRGGRLDPRVTSALDKLLPPAGVGVFFREELEPIGDSRDPRLAWIVSDLLRFYQGVRVDEDALVDTFEQLTGVDVRADPLFTRGSWRSVTDHLLAWDLPAPPGYRERKAELYLALEPGWKPFFDDSDADIDWRRIAWGGVLIDDRPLGDPRPCIRGCIPALDDPALVPASAGDWYAEDGIVFGVVVAGEAVAFPKNVMEVHEMVNITIGGRRLGIPYCTLCGSAQAYFLDDVPAALGPLVLRTSGLLSRSNKVMYDLTSSSVLDTFTGRALSGPLQDAGVALPQTTVVASTWGKWKAAHPETRIVARDGGIGRRYPDDPLRGRDDQGPIFPIGKADPRLPVQAKVVGVVAPGGTPVAFEARDARLALAEGDVVALADVQLALDGGGLRAYTGDGRELAAHEAFWFAWSQFHPGTKLWTRP